VHEEATTVFQHELLCNKGTALAGPQSRRRGERALAPAMTHPARNASAASILNPVRTFFVTTKTATGKRILQSERNAGLLIEVLRTLVTERKFELHDFVIMPDHMHLLLTVHDEMTVEKAMPLIKGRFSHCLSKEFGQLSEIWQRGFAEEQVMNRDSFESHRRYIAQNPVKAGLAAALDEYPFCFGALAKKKAAVRASRG